MTKNFLALGALLAVLIALPVESLASGPTNPSVVLLNQFGEKSINLVVGGSSLDCSFKVDSANANGLGISGLSGSACAAVYMHTSQTAAVGNPNPPAGYILIKLASNYNGYVGSYSGFISPANSLPILATTGVVAHGAYVISTVGTTSLSGWQNLGLPAGVTPAVGESFIAPGTTVSTGSGVIVTPATAGSGAFVVDTVGDPALEVSATGGARVLMRVLAATSSSVTSLVPAAPVDNSVAHIHLVMLPLASQLK